ncbi:MAG: N-acetyltransferase [Croceibacterium sp.]
MAAVTIEPVAGKREFNAFIDFAYKINRDDPHWVPPLRSEVVELLTPGKNPFHEHAKVQLFLARRAGQVVGRISAHYDELALTQPPEQGMGPGTGNWGMFEARDEVVAHALIARAEDWLREQGMTRVLAPISLSIWEEPGLLVKGHDHAPMVMMGHNLPQYEAWIEHAGYTPAKALYTYELPVQREFPPLIGRIVTSGESNPRINVRRADKKHFKRETEIIIRILNDAWSANWGFVPFTATEEAYAAKKMAPLIFEGAVMIAELDGEPAAFMMALPDVNAVIRPMGGKLFPFNFIKLLWWLRKARGANFRVPLMGVVKKLQSSRVASQLAFMMIEYIRRYAAEEHGAQRGEVGWILEDNKGMIAIAEAIAGKINREYRIYQKPIELPK